MSFNDSLSDMLARIKNAHRANKSSTSCYNSKLNNNVLTVLKDEGYIRDFQNVKIRDGVDSIKIELKYHNGLPVIKRIKRISKPGIRVYSKIKEKLTNNKDLLGKIRLISLSFDPLFDTPQVMKLYGKDLLSEDVDWRFLTTRSYRELNPIMKNYQQPVIRKYSENGEYQGVDAHILRVFLIDKNKVIRNIYSVSFLHPDLLINDIKTLLIEGK